MKIDCSKAGSYLKEMSRFCKTNRKDCRCCPINIDERPQEMGCEEFMYKYPEEVIEIVQKWSDEHPPKTRREWFSESISNCSEAEKEEILKAFSCVVSFGYPKAEGCPDGNCDCEECWNVPI